MVLVDFDWKNWVLTKMTGFGRFRPEKLVLVDFGRKMWLWSILGHFGFPDEFFELETEI